MKQTKPEKVYCNCLAQERGLLPQGHAGSFDDAVLVETPLPWPQSIFQKVGALPQEAIDLLELWLEHYKMTGIYGHRPLVIAPDPAYSQEGCRRVLFYRRPNGLFARFAKTEYLVPEAEVGKLLWAWFQTPAALPNFDAYRVPDADSTRDILVCTHGAVDAACAKFGYPLYKQLREDYANDTLRVWRVSHFGGHVFAPTLLDMPTGHYWAFVGAAQVEQIVKRTGDVSALRGHYRGWAGASYGLMQAAEGELWQRLGWRWLNYPRRGEVLLQDEADEPGWANVRFSFEDDEGQQVCDMRAELSHRVETPPKSRSEESYAYPQYRVAELEITSKSARQAVQVTPH